jgi:hypothetical protein
MDRYYFHHIRRTLYIRKMHILRPGFMKFEGYWHEEAKNLPLETLFYCDKDVYWIRIDSKKQHTIDNINESDYDEDYENNICYFPLYMIELEFTVLAKNMSNEKYKQIVNDIEDDNRILDERDSIDKK